MITQPVLRVTDVQIELPVATSSPRMLAYANVTIEHAIVIRSIRLIRMDDGRIIVAMPSRKRTRICEGCRNVVPAEHDWCGCCGDELPYLADPGKPCDVVSWTSARQREAIDGAVLRAYDRKTSEVAVAEWEGTRSLVRVGA